MKTLFIFDIQSYFKLWGFYLVVAFIVFFGIIGGHNARFSISEDVFQNSPYQISFIVSFISLTTIFFSTIFGSQLLLKEYDNRFELIIFSSPITKKQFIFGRYLSLLFIAVVFTLLLTISFVFGQSLQSQGLKSDNFSIIHYLSPLFFFTFINTLFSTSLIFFVAWISKSKMMIFVNGLMLYIVYMVTMIFSSSPFMAQSLPQSNQSKFISAILDPFGLSAFFNQTSQWSVLKRNTDLISLDGLFIINRLMVIAISVLLLFICYKKFSFTEKKKIKKSKVHEEFIKSISITPFQFVNVNFTFKAELKALLSYIKINLIYIIKSIPFVITVIAILFAVGMEMYAEIEKGVRIPQKYASSGLMTSTIIQNFYYLGIIAVIYYTNDIFWRSKNANFNLIEDSTANTKMNFYAKWFSLSILLIIFSGLLVLEGVLFQMAYNYPKIEGFVYAQVLLFNTLPLILLSGFLLLIHKICNQKYLALGLTALFAFVMATPLGKKVVQFPLLRFLNTISFDYSDMNGFGSYSAAFSQRLLFGFCMVIILILVLQLFKKENRKKSVLAALLFMIGLGFYIGSNLMDGYKSKNENTELELQAQYEKQFRKYQNVPQPTIVNIKTTVDLFPKENKYNIKGHYILENKTELPIKTILVNFADNFIINAVTYQNGNENKKVENQYQVINLKNSLLPNQKATLQFDISYDWKAVNGHQSFNAIVENGTFIRISRYYPQLGYNPGTEIQDKKIRGEFKLGKPTTLKSFDAPKIRNNDFINLDMTISTDVNQVAIGVGELHRQWSTKTKAFYHYKTNASIPFRFAISSAKYAIKRENYKGKKFEIYYHPSHHENVNHLLKNAKLTMDYCEANFGKYPFETIRFAEVSSFTRGFAATAYPATIFMTENMIFHCNIKADKQQDVINELAGHELSHLWWGNNQISPDERDGAAMLTETLAMYTEMMLIKKMYGKEKMLERIQMHQSIYNNEKGFTDEQPLYLVKDESTHISYSKGAVVMYELSELIGEDKVNLALKNFLNKNSYPNDKPISTDLIKEFYKVSDNKFHRKIENMFMKVDY